MEIMPGQVRGGLVLYLIFDPTEILEGRKGSDIT